jgi:aspartate/methionine/tyrosine aminotransferase
MRFSTRVPDDRAPTRLARAVAEARSARPLVDLTLSNPTRAGISYPAGLLTALADPAALTYSPAALGMAEARAAVAGTYQRRGLSIPPEHIVLTASTSEAYSLLFKLLCEPGRSDVLTPAPSYPLFDHLARLDGVDQRRYHLDYHGRWSVDTASLDQAWTAETRAVLAVSPNNPTGSVLRDADAAAMVDRCAAREAALIVDEVFWDYPLREPLADAAPLRQPRCLVARLGGLSKSIGLPQVKLGWIALDGPARLVSEALDRLELIADTYLSVSTPVQVAAPALLRDGACVRDAIQARVRDNYATLCGAARPASAISVLAADAGWSAVLRVPATRPEEDLALDLLQRDGVIVHPGYFFDFPHEAFLVISLLPPTDDFARGIARVFEAADAA